MPSAAALLSWYAQHRRHLPWRAPPGEVAEPYHVWLSEIMLQQTQVATVIPYYAKFLAAYPTIYKLAAAPTEDVLGLWAGLGYYARGRNLHACAVQVSRLGGFPKTFEGLRALPGVGPYTAAAIAAIACNLPVLPVDGNVERVTARIFGITDKLPAAKPAIAAAAARFMEDAQARAAPGDFTQAMFDLGATLCTPRRPACILCPWNNACQAQARGIAASLPARAPKPPRPARIGEVYVLLDQHDNLFLLRRPNRGLLGGMLAAPETAPLSTTWRNCGKILHVFTHFSLTLTVYAARCDILPPGLHAPARTAALPSVMRKAVDKALSESAALDAEGGCVKNLPNAQVTRPA